MAPDALIPVHTIADASNRINLPRHFSDHLGWNHGSKPAQVWLFLVTPGRYRLLSDAQVQGDAQLEPVRMLILEGKPAILMEPTYAEDPKRASLAAKLVPVQISPPGPAWRISFPKAFDAFTPPDCDRKAFSIILSLEGYVEIWCTDLLRKAVVPFGTQQ